MSRGGDLGMMIMMLCGFAAYMTHIGANDMVVKLASKPLQYINSPYLLMIAACQKLVTDCCAWRWGLRCCCPCIRYGAWRAEMRA